MPIPQKNDNRGAKVSMFIPALIPVEYYTQKVNLEISIFMKFISAFLLRIFRFKLSYVN